jgi:1,4-alpha-glucan branching enzyme
MKQGRNVYQSPVLDAGFEYPAKTVKRFLDSGSSRCSTGYRYWTEDRNFYDPDIAAKEAAAAAGTFFDQRVSRLAEAQSYMDCPAISLWAVDADTLGRSWYEGMIFLKALVKKIGNRTASQDRPLPEDQAAPQSQQTPRFLTPLEYLTETPHTSFQVLEPDYSSSLRNGYGEELLDASNDWIYRHIFRFVQRMAEMTERFFSDTGLKERALNQAARELLLAQSTDLSKPLNPQYQGRLLSKEYAGKELEGVLRNFTTIYETLGNGHISTEWLTALERKHSLLPYINYRVFAKRQ